MAVEEVDEGLACVATGADEGDFGRPVAALLLVTVGRVGVCGGVAGRCGGVGAEWCREWAYARSWTWLSVDHGCSCTAYGSWR